MGDDRTQLLRRMPIFGGVGDEALGFLLERSTPVRVAEGESFFEEGSHGTSAFVLESGSVSIRKRMGGGEQELGRLGEGDCFGEVALLDFGPRSASVVATSDCSALELTARDLAELSRTSLEPFALIYMNLGRELARRLRHADDLLLQARLDRYAPAADYPFNPS